MTRRALLLALVVLAPASSLAQTAVVTRNVNLRTAPTTESDVIRLLEPPDELTILDPRKVNGYYEVRTAGGEPGWVWGENVRLTGPIPAEPASDGPAVVYRGCPLEGSALQEERRASNRKKNRLTGPAPADIDSTVTLAALLAPGGDAKRGSDMRGASIVGYVVEVKQGGEETVNCGERDVRHRDTHIDVVLDSTDTRRIVRVVVEVTPRWRAYMASRGVDWSTATLEQELVGNWARFTGWLFWDFEHAGEAENTNPGGKGNWRATAWEIHPVTDLKVCPGAPQSCD